MRIQYDTSFGRTDEVKRPRHGLPWTDDELKTLRSLFMMCHSLKVICEQMQRPAAGVISKLVHLNLIEFDAQQCRYFYVQNPPVQPRSPSQLQPKKELTMAAKNIETQILIRGTDASTMTDAQIFSLISNLESEIEALSAIKVNSKKIGAAMNKLQIDIDKLAAYVDGRP